MTLECATGTVGILDMVLFEGRRLNLGRRFGVSKMHLSPQ